MTQDRVNVVKSVLEKTRLSNGVEYTDIKSILDDLINEENERKLSNKYTIDLEGDFVFSGDFNETVDFIKRNRLSRKRNKNEYGLTTPTDTNIVLCRSIEFGHLFQHE